MTRSIRSSHRLSAAACLVAWLALALGGCATDLTQRDATGNPQVARLDSAALARSLPEPPPVPSKEDIVRMSRSGVPAPEIIERIRTGGGRYPLTPDEIADLRARGVAPVVIEHLVAAERAAQLTDRADQEARAERALADRYRYSPRYAPYYGYPRPYYYGHGYLPWAYSPYLGYGSGPHGSGWYGGIRVW